jgi:hypothetical protein
MRPTAEQQPTSGSPRPTFPAGRGDSLFLHIIIDPEAPS